ncbi:sigma factor-like helix-turn-helix DNA-binding protein [Planctomycetota bacterium]
MGRALNDVSTDGRLLAVTGLTAGALRKLAFHFANRWAWERLRDDAAGAFLLGAVRAAQYVDCTRRDANPKHYVIKGGVQALLEFLRRETKQRPVGTVALDAPLGAESESTVGELVPDERAARAFDGLLVEDTARVVRAAVAGLPAREREAVELVDLGGVQVLDAGRAMGLSRQRVHQLRARAMPKLRGALKLAGCV